MNKYIKKVYKGDAKEAAFLLGGIGTGNVSIGARGELRDWEIFNRPGKGYVLPYSFFTIWTKKNGETPIAKVIESKLNPPFSRAHGFNSPLVAGLPRFDQSYMSGDYPFVNIDFEDKELPVKVSLEAFTPFIPLNADDSGIPAAVIRYKVKNISKEAVDVTIAGSLANASGFEGYNAAGNIKLTGKNSNQFKEDKKIKGIFYSSNDESSVVGKGSMALLTRDENITYKTEWLKGGWWDGVQEFWNDFTEDGKLEKESVYTAEGSKANAVQTKIGSLGILHSLEAEEEYTFEFILSWYFPYRAKNWDVDCCSGGCDCDCQYVKNYYSIKFKNAWQAGGYILENMVRLEKLSKDFQTAFFSSTLPGEVVDAAAANITVLRSTTCFRLDNGNFLGYEGCNDTKGCCVGNCTHVWNYAQTIAFLFPELEQTMRRVEFAEADEVGNMPFRIMQVLGQERHHHHPAADGQMGTIIRLYRDWKISGNDVLIRDLWDSASRALDFAFFHWDTDEDFVMDSQQHNTYDIEFYGPNALTNSMFYAALKAGAEMAEYLGDTAHKEKYEKALAVGSKKMDELLWNGEYYIQKLEDVNQYRYQYGEGCLSDQVFGQFMAHVAGLGYVLPEDHVKKAVKSIFKYNYKETFEKHHSVQRTYALNDEKGLVLCSWPKGGRPKLPFVYSDEVWTGIEYQVAAHLIYEGFIEEGLTIVKSVRERHDGYRRNPWNEVECGYHYARAMASWAVLTALCGYKYDLVNKKISFEPVVNADNFTTFWSTGNAWGTYKQTIDTKTGERKWDINVLYGSLDGVKVN